MKEAIISELSKILGLKLQNAGRASNLFWLGFGEMISITKRERTDTVAEYALNIQCSWRICKGKRILVASRDFYSPFSEWDEANGDFDWDVQGSNRFDELIKSLLKRVQGNIIVESIDSDEVGGLKVFLSEGFVLEVFPDSTQDDEYSEFWRFFNRKNTSPHFVVTINGIDKV